MTAFSAMRERDRVREQEQEGERAGGREKKREVGRGGERKGERDRIFEHAQALGVLLWDEVLPRGPTLPAV